MPAKRQPLPMVHQLQGAIRTSGLSLNELGRRTGAQPERFAGSGGGNRDSSSPLINNGTMGGYDRHIPFAGERFRSRFLGGDYGKVAEGLGVIVERVTEPSEIIPALQRAISVTGCGSEPVAGGGRPALVEFVTREETRLSKPW